MMEPTERRKKRIRVSTLSSMGKGIKYQDSGSHGIDNATWKQLRNALERFGAKRGRATSKEQNTLYVLPTGHKISIRERWNENAGRGGVSNVIAQVAEAGIPKPLFLAALMSEGVRFIKPETDIAKVSHYLKQQNPKKTATRQGWEKTYFKALEYVESLDKPTPPPPELPTAKQPSLSMQFPFTIRDAVEMATSDPELIRHYQVGVTAKLSDNLPLGRVLREKGEIHEKARGKQKKYRLSEKGAERVANYVAERLATRFKRDLEREKDMGMYPDKSAAELRAEQQAQRVEELSKEDIQNMQERGTELVQSLLKLCQILDVPPVIDVKATLENLAKGKGE